MVILKTTFSKHQLIKISVTHVYIKPEVDTKVDITATASATNEACILELDENYYLMGKE